MQGENGNNIKNFGMCIAFKKIIKLISIHFLAEFSYEHALEQWTIVLDFIASENLGVLISGSINLSAF